MGTRWGYSGDQVRPGGDPVGTRTNGPAMQHGHSWQDKAAVPLKYKTFDNYNNDGKPIKRHAARYLRIFEGIGWAAYTTCLSISLPSCLGCGISIFPSAVTNHDRSHGANERLHKTKQSSSREKLLCARAMMTL